MSNDDTLDRLTAALADEERRVGDARLELSTAVGLAEDARATLKSYREREPEPAENSVIIFRMTPDLGGATYDVVGHRTGKRWYTTAGFCPDGYTWARLMEIKRAAHTKTGITVLRDGALIP